MDMPLRNAMAVSAQDSLRPPSHERETCGLILLMCEDETATWENVSKIKAGDILTACKINDERFLQQTIEESPELIHEPSYDGWTPLYMASRFGHANLVRKLLKAGAVDSDSSAYRVALNDSCKQLLKPRPALTSEELRRKLEKLAKKERRRKGKNRISRPLYHRNRRSSGPSNILSDLTLHGARTISLFDRERCYEHQPCSCKSMEDFTAPTSQVTETPWAASRVGLVNDLMPWDDEEWEEVTADTMWAEHSMPSPQCGTGVDMNKIGAAWKGRTFQNHHKASFRDEITSLWRLFTRCEGDESSKACGDLMDDDKRDDDVINALVVVKVAGSPEHTLNEWISQRSYDEEVDHGGQADDANDNYDDISSGECTYEMVDDQAERNSFFNLIGVASSDVSGFFNGLSTTLYLEASSNDEAYTLFHQPRRTSEHD